MKIIMIRVVLNLLLIFLSVNYVSSSRNYFVFSNMKSWIRKTPQSWRDWNTRVALDHINFPTNLEVPLAFPTQGNAGCEIILPMDDVANDEEFVQSPSEGACPKDANTLPEDDVLWINPDNWLPSSFTTVMIDAVPHIERLPCSYDYVRFGSGLGDFIVVLPNKSINIQKMSYEDSVLSRFNFQSNMKKESFVKHFVVYGEMDATKILNFTGKDCPEVTGCVCGTMKFYDEVCALMKPKCDPSLACPHPIQPMGHCCPMCGTYIVMYFDPDTFVFKKFYTVVYDKKLADMPAKIQYHISKISEAMLHVVFISEDEQEYDENAIYNIANDFAEFVKGVDHLGILDFRITSSGNDPNPWSKIIRTILYVVACTALLGGYILCTRSTKNMQIFAIFTRKTSEFVKLESTIEQNSRIDEAQTNDADTSSSTHNYENFAEAESEDKSESDEVLIKLATSDGKDVPESQSKETEEIEVLLDISGSAS